MKKPLIRLTLILLGLITSLVLIVALVFRRVNYTNGTLVSSGVTRAYLLYIPKSYQPSVPTPLVITIHGFAQWPAHQMQLSHWNDLADQYGFIVVYPSGTHFPLRWHTGGANAADTSPEQDVTFISDLIDKLASQYNIDPSRIYANGLSNGGGMSFVLSCKLSERIAAVGLVAGAYVYPWEECLPARLVPAVVFHGTADPIVPYQGGPSRSFAVPFPAIPQWVAALASHHECDEMPTELPTGGEVSGVQYANCTAEVVFYTITGGGHAWPGGEPIPQVIVGYTTQEIDATQVIWDFFLQHPLPAE